MDYPVADRVPSQIPRTTEVVVVSQSTPRAGRRNVESDLSFVLFLWWPDLEPSELKTSRGSLT